MINKAIKYSAATVAAATALYVTKPSSHVVWKNTDKGPVIIRTEQVSLLVKAITSPEKDTFREENIIFHTMENKPKWYEHLLSGTIFACSPKSPANPIPPSPFPPSTSEFPDWGLTKIHGDEALLKVPQGKIRVCIIDTGIDLTHPDLPKPILTNDFSGSGIQDYFGHGTHVAGIISAIDNDFGVRGVSNSHVDLLIARALDANGSGSLDGIANAMRWCADNGSRIVSMSLGSSEPSELMRQMVLYLGSRSIQVVMANGNDSGPVGSPARYADGINSFAISATGFNDSITNFSSRGYETSYAAPGLEVNSTVPVVCQMCGANSNGYSKASGTSMATPYVAGVCALHLLVGNKDCSGLGIGYLGNPFTHGKGRVDALLSVTSKDISALNDARKYFVITNKIKKSQDRMLKVLHERQN